MKINFNSTVSPVTAVFDAYKNEIVKELSNVEGFEDEIKKAVEEGNANDYIAKIIMCVIAGIYAEETGDNDEDVESVFVKAMIACGDFQF